MPTGRFSPKTRPSGPRLALPPGVLTRLAWLAVGLWLCLPAGAGPLSERIFFVADTGGLSKIYVVRPDGKDLKRLTRGLGSEREPSVSPQQRAVAFRSNQDQNPEIYRVNLTATGDGREGGYPSADIVRLTHSQDLDRHPCWSPDGERIVFSTRRYGAEELAIMSAVEGDRAEVVRLTWDQAESTWPNWSPDGKWIAYCSNRLGQSDIYMCRPDGSDNTRLTRDRYVDVSPAWSPDSQKLVYQTQRGPRLKPVLAVIDPFTGGEPTILDKIPEIAHFPSWAPDSSTILYVGSGSRYYPKVRQLQLYDTLDGSTRVLELGNLFPGGDPLAAYESTWTRFPLPW